MLKYLLTLFLTLPIFAETLKGKVVKITDGDMPSNNNVLMTLL